MMWAGSGPLPAERTTDPAGGIEVAVAGIGVILLAAAVPVKLLPELEG